MVSQVLGKRLLQFLLVFFGITLITFAILHLSPKNPAELWLIGPGGQAGMVSEEALAAQEKAMGLDQPFLVQYGRWLLGAIQGDLGLSFQSKEPVSALLLRHMGPTLWMTGCAFLGTLLWLCRWVCFAQCGQGVSWTGCYRVWAFSPFLCRPLWWRCFCYGWFV